EGEDARAIAADQRVEGGGIPALRGLDEGRRLHPPQLRFRQPLLVPWSHVVVRRGSPGALGSEFRGPRKIPCTRPGAADRAPEDAFTTRASRSAGPLDRPRAIC